MTASFSFKNKFDILFYCFETLSLINFKILQSIFRLVIDNFVYLFGDFKKNKEVILIDLKINCIKAMRLGETKCLM